MVKASPITSLQNTHVRSADKLKLRRYREQTRRFLAEGPRILEEALRADVIVCEVFMSSAFLGRRSGRKLGSWAEASGAEIHEVSEPVLKKLSDTPSPQGIVAVLETRPLERDDLTLPGDAFVVVCDRVQDPGNLGSIVRVADAAGAHAVLISAASCDLYNPKTVRTTMGSLFHLPVIQGGRALELIRWIRSKGITVAAASQHGDLAYSHVDTRGAICWVMGNEAKGLSREALEACDVVVRIPMPGRAESLNVAAAASILMYEVVRQRMAGGDPVRAP